MTLSFPQFEDLDRGLPRQRVAVRIACVVTNWPPQLLASLIVSCENVVDRQLLAYELNKSTGAWGDVAALSYADIARLSGPTRQETLGQVPANHFVWSDELADAYSDYIDNTIGRDEAHRAGAYLRWTPAVGDLLDLLKECPNPSSSRADTCRITCDGNVWTFMFAGRPVSIKHEKGFAYLQQLLRNPGKHFSYQELYDAVNPRAMSEAVREFSVMSEETLADEGFHVIGAGPTEFSIDDKTRHQMRTRIGKLDDDLEEARLRGDEARIEAAENQKQEYIDYLSQNLNKHGQPRVVDIDYERVRKSLSIAISRAINTLVGCAPELAAHLQEHLRTDVGYIYHAPAEISWHA